MSKSDPDSAIFMEDAVEDLTVSGGYWWLLGTIWDPEHRMILGLGKYGKGNFSGFVLVVLDGFAIFNWWIQ